MISVSRNFIFVHIGKTGGTAVQTAIAPYCIDGISYRQKHGGVPQLMIHNPYRIKKHHPLSAYKKRIPSEIFNKMAIVATIRNPWDRAISVYFSAHRETPLWDAKFFVAVIKRNMQSVSEYLDIGGADHILRFEHLQTDFDGFCDAVGIGRVVLPYVNVSERVRDYRHYYTPRLQSFIADKFKEDIEMGAYEF